LKGVLKRKIEDQDATKLVNELLCSRLLEGLTMEQRNKIRLDSPLGLTPTLHSYCSRSSEWWTPNFAASDSSTIVNRLVAPSLDNIHSKHIRVLNVPIACMTNPTMDVLLSTKRWGIQNIFSGSSDSDGHIDSIPGTFSSELHNALNRNSQRNNLSFDSSLNPFWQSSQPHPLAALALEQQSIRASGAIQLGILSLQNDETFLTGTE
jgi:hypothetical protein